VEKKKHKNTYILFLQFVHIGKKQIKHYPNVQVSPETFEILGILKRE
jgi:hypothetical protein